MTDWTPEEDEAFNDVEKHSNLGKQILREIGQPYYYDLSISYRNQVLEEAAKVCEDKNTLLAWPTFADAIRGMKK